MAKIAEKLKNKIGKLAKYKVLSAIKKPTFMLSRIDGKWLDGKSDKIVQVRNKI